MGEAHGGRREGGRSVSVTAAAAVSRENGCYSRMNIEDNSGPPFRWSVDAGGAAGSPRGDGMVGDAFAEAVGAGSTLNDHADNLPGSDGKMSSIISDHVPFALFPSNADSTYSGL